MTNSKDNEIVPPWILFPGYPPGDGFWRQSAEGWFTFIWRPFWEKLSPMEQVKYLHRWKVPDEWRLFYFDSDFKKWLEKAED